MANNSTTRRGSDKQVSEAEEKAQDKGNTKKMGESREIWRLVRVLGLEKDDSFTCRTMQCEKNAVSLWMAGNTSEEWPVCEACQEKDFGGWPEGMESTCEKEQMPTHPRRNDDDSFSQSSLTAAKQAVDQDKTEEIELAQEAKKEDDEAAEEVWDLKKIMSIDDVTHECPIKCSHEDCPLPAAVGWVSNQNPNSKWYSCLDHQVSVTSRSMGSARPETSHTFRT